MEPYQDMTDLVKVLMHPAPLAILEMQRDGEECACHLTAMLGARQAYVSQQLMVLREAGLVIARHDGWNIDRCGRQDPPAHPAPHDFNPELC